MSLGSSSSGKGHHGCVHEFKSPMSKKKKFSHVYSFFTVVFSSFFIASSFFMLVLIALFRDIRVRLVTRLKRDHSSNC